MLDTLQELKRYEDYVRNVDVKKDLVYQFYTRPAVAWTCSRAEMRDAIDTMLDIDVDDLEDGEN